jgi:hypothetical protein
MPFVQQDIRTAPQGNGALRTGAQGQAGHAQDGGFLLYTAGVGQDDAGIFLQANHVGIAHRIEQGGVPSSNS